MYIYKYFNNQYNLKGLYALFTILYKYCRRGCKIPGLQVAVENKLCKVMYNFCGAPVGYLLCHPLGVWSFVAIPRFLENLCAPNLTSEILNVICYI
jgi:hypothetical protein